jgi:hypothetical protein
MGKNLMTGGINPPWLFFAFGVVLLWLGFALHFWGDPSEDVRGVPYPIFAWLAMGLGVFSLALGVYYFLKRRSS